MVKVWPLVVIMWIRALSRGMPILWVDRWKTLFTRLCVEVMGAWFQVFYLFGHFLWPNSWAAFALPYWQFRPCRPVGVKGPIFMVVKGLQQGLVGKVKVPTVDEVPKAISRWPCWEAEYLQGLCVCVCCLIQNWLLWTIELYFAIAHPVIQSNFRQLTDTSPWSRTGGPAFEELK